MAALIETDGHPPDEQPWQAFVDTLPVGLAVATFGDEGPGHTVAANPALRVLLRGTSGTPPNLLADRTWVDLEERNRLQAALRESHGVTDMPARLRRADGTVVHVEITGTCVGSREPATGNREPGGGTGPATGNPPAGNGQPGTGNREAGNREPGTGNRGETVYLLVRDVGERRRREEQSRDLYQQLLQAEKMAALGQTMSGVAHELNNPLGAILALAERLRLQGARTPLAAGLATLHKEAERAARIARQLLTFASKRHTTRLMVPVNEVVAETVRLREADLQRAGIRVTSSLAPDLPDVFADPHQLQQVVLNLLINAEHALVRAEEGGHVHLRTTAESTDSVRIEVRDNGPGMSAEVQGRIFDPFFTTKDVGEGTGLGLAVAQAIVAEHGGHIDVESSPGAGRAFRDRAAGRGRDRAGAARAHRGARRHDRPLRPRSPGAARRRRTRARRCGGRHPARRGVRGDHGERRRGGAGPGAGPDVRRRHLRPAHAAGRWPDVLPGHRGVVAASGAAGDLRDR